MLLIFLSITQIKKNVLTNYFFNAYIDMAGLLNTLLVEVLGS